MKKRFIVLLLVFSFLLTFFEFNVFANTSNGTKTTTKSAKPKVKPKTSSRGIGSFNASKIISFGLTFKGTPYRYAGRSAKGFDCSGFTSYVFKTAAGINLPHSAKGQAVLGTPVSKSNLIPGDIVYFNTNGKNISHVGIYVGGNKFMHASYSKGITVTSLDSSYYHVRYRGARRIR